MSYTDVDNWTPASSDSENSGLFYQALRSSPLTPVKFTDGQWGYGGSSANPIAQAYDGGFINYHKRETSLNFSAGLRIIDGLTARFNMLPGWSMCCGNNNRTSYSTFIPIPKRHWLIRRIRVSSVNAILPNDTRM